MSANIDDSYGSLSAGEHPPSSDFGGLPCSERLASRSFSEGWGSPRGAAPQKISMMLEDSYNSFLLKMIMPINSVAFRCRYV